MKPISAFGPSGGVVGDALTLMSANIITKTPTAVSEMHLIIINLNRVGEVPQFDCACCS